MARTTNTEREQLFSEAAVYLDHLYRVAVHLAREPDDAQDLVQETYLRAISAYEQFIPETNMKAWLTRILYNLFIDDYHKRKRWISTEEGFIGEKGTAGDWEMASAESSGPEGNVLMWERNAKIADAIRKLPEEFRTTIVLVDMGDFSYAQAAEILSCPVGTIRSRISRSRKLLHKYLYTYVGNEEEKR